ncbi:hypothetical protein U3516DRAFT_835327 [Neocallimastix sp. 'constans']
MNNDINFDSSDESNSNNEESLEYEKNENNSKNEKSFEFEKNKNISNNERSSKFENDYNNDIENHNYKKNKASINNTNSSSKSNSYSNNYNKIKMLSNGSGDKASTSILVNDNKTKKMEKMTNERINNTNECPINNEFSVTESRIEQLDNLKKTLDEIKINIKGKSKIEDCDHESEISSHNSDNNDVNNFNDETLSNIHEGITNQQSYSKFIKNEENTNKYENDVNEIINDFGYNSFNNIFDLNNHLYEEPLNEENTDNNNSINQKIKKLSNDKCSTKIESSNNNSLHDICNINYTHDNNYFDQTSSVQEDNENLISNSTDINTICSINNFSNCQCDNKTSKYNYLSSSYKNNNTIRFKKDFDSKDIRKPSSYESFSNLLTKPNVKSNNEMKNININEFIDRNNLHQNISNADKNNIYNNYHTTNRKLNNHNHNSNHNDNNVNENNNNNIYLTNFNTINNNSLISYNKNLHNYSTNFVNKINTLSSSSSGNTNEGITDITIASYTEDSNNTNKKNIIKELLNKINTDIKKKSNSDD